MAPPQQLKLATEKTKIDGVHCPNESARCGRARDALLAEEIELRRPIAQATEQRRALPADDAGMPAFAVFTRRRAPLLERRDGT